MNPVLPRPAARPKQEIGLPVPDAALPSIGGDGERTLGDCAAGKKGLVIVFWSGVCSHCVRYDGYFNSFAERHPDLGLVMIASRQG